MKRQCNGQVSPSDQRPELGSLIDEFLSINLYRVDSAMDIAAKSGFSQSFARIWTVASNVFLEVVRDRILYVVGVFAIVMVLAIAMLPEVSAGTEDKLILDTGLAAINLLSLFVVVFIGTGLINKEIGEKEQCSC